MRSENNAVSKLYFTKDHEMVRRVVRDFVNKEINPNMDEWEDNGSGCNPGSLHG